MDIYTTTMREYQHSTAMDSISYVYYRKETLFHDDIVSMGAETPNTLWAPFLIRKTIIFKQMNKDNE